MSARTVGVLPRVLVTGANGFVGTELCTHLRQKGYEVVSAMRRATVPGSVGVGAIDEGTVWGEALQGVEVVVHLAARVHMMGEPQAGSEAQFERVNVQGSTQLAHQAVVAGVKRFVFVSSIKVNGEATHGSPYTETDAPKPEDAYGRSKLAAELALAKIARETGLELVIVRPPMVVGPGAKGNLPILLRGLQHGWPLPLASVRNLRSFVGVRNLADLLELCAVHPAAAGELFLAADEPALSTVAFIEGLALGLQRRARLWPMPVAALRALSALLGKGPQIKRLSGDLQVNPSKARRVLGWECREPLDDALYRTADQFLKAS